MKSRVIFNAGFPQRLEILKNENGHGKVVEYEKLGGGEFMEVVISHGILSLVPPIFCISFKN